MSICQARNCSSVVITDIFCIKHNKEANELYQDYKALCSGLVDHKLTDIKYVKQLKADILTSERFYKEELEGFIPKLKACIEKRKEYSYIYFPYIDSTNHNKIVDRYQFCFDILNPHYRKWKVRNKMIYEKNENENENKGILDDLDYIISKNTEIPIVERKTSTVKRKKKRKKVRQLKELKDDINVNDIKRIDFILVRPIHFKDKTQEMREYKIVKSKLNRWMFMELEDKKRVIATVDISYSPVVMTITNKLVNFLANRDKSSIIKLINDMNIILRMAFNIDDYETFSREIIYGSSYNDYNYILGKIKREDDILRNIAVDMAMEISDIVEIIDRNIDVRVMIGSWLTYVICIIESRHPDMSFYTYKNINNQPRPLLELNEYPDDRLVKPHYLIVNKKIECGWRWINPIDSSKCIYVKFMPQIKKLYNDIKDIFAKYCRMCSNRDQWDIYVEDFMNILYTRLCLIDYITPRIDLYPEAVIGRIKLPILYSKKIKLVSRDIRHTIDIETIYNMEDNLSELKLTINRAVTAQIIESFCYYITPCIRGSI